MPVKQTVRLMIQAAPAAVQQLTGASFALKDRGRFQLEPMFPPVTEAETQQFYQRTDQQWFVADTRTPAGPDTDLWEVAHQFVEQQLGGENGAISYAEPDLLQQVPSALPYVPTPQAPEGPGIGWHLLDEYSGLRTAAQQADQGLGIRIGWIDSGYDANHTLLPANLKTTLGRDFVEGRSTAEEPNTDPNQDPPQSGQGTGTLSILAGNRMNQITNPPQAKREEYYGGAPLADIIPVRVADSSVSFYSSGLARALFYLLAPNNNPNLCADIICINLGGVPSALWVEAVNRAYDLGVCLVASAGDHWAGAGSTRHMNYPARSSRVVAVTGAMADQLHYASLPEGTLEGNEGPPSKTNTISAYTPNIAWAKLGVPTALDLGGAGTASATPQVAAAAALWLAKHRDFLASPVLEKEPWRKVESIRKALADGARKGRLDARNTLVQSAQPETVAWTEPDRATFPFFARLELFPAAPRQTMFQLEMMQLAQRSAALEKIIPDPDDPSITDEQLRCFVTTAAGDPKASSRLRLHLASVYAAKFTAVKPEIKIGKPNESDPAQAPYYPPPPHRRLQAYAFDPSLTLDYENEAINRVTLRVPWEPLLPGPVGDYLEVVDQLPNGTTQFAPINLDEPRLLAQDGLPPQQDNPQFHQQMVYAVARKTIEFFETALGRPVFWSGYGVDPKNPIEEHWQQRLKIMPHALVVANAFYSPERKALLFGSFSAKSSDVARQVPGERVFTALSHDIVAHETTHAILDGLHYWLREPTNPDMLAFHEGFADIVALFQHFSMQEVLESQILAKRGDLEVAELLTNLGRQFGRANSNRDFLRSGLGKANPEDYKTKMEPHERGSILVAAVFEAFLMIYKRRAQAVINLASAGSGILPPGNLPPVLSGALARAASSAATHVLKMNIRALDYIPPVDLTFGDYLRALITADYEFSQEDRDGYRIAFVDAFRRRGIYPPGLETLTVTGLRWPKLDIDKSAPALVPQFKAIMDQLRAFAETSRYAMNREALFQASQDGRKQMKQLLRNMLSGMSETDRAQMTKLTGLELRQGEEFEVYQLRLTNRMKIDGATKAQVVLGVTQVKQEFVQPPDSKPFQFRGGSIFIVDLEAAQIRYAIVKDATDPKRIEKQRKYLLEDTKGLAYFRNQQFATGLEPFMLLHQNDQIPDDEA